MMARCSYGVTCPELMQCTPHAAVPPRRRAGGHRVLVQAQQHVATFWDGDRKKPGLSCSSLLRFVQAADSPDLTFRFCMHAQKTKRCQSGAQTQESVCFRTATGSELEPPAADLGVQVNLLGRRFDAWGWATGPADTMLARARADLKIGELVSTNSRENLPF